MTVLGVSVHVQYGRAKRAYDAAIAELGDHPLRNAFPLSAPPRDASQNREVYDRLKALVHVDPDLIAACVTTRPEEF